MNSMNLKSFIKGSKDDTHSAIDGLNAFTKNWCMDVKLTERRGDLVFRCDKCEFSIDGNCLIKQFAYNKDETYTREVDFGCMGLL